jgi:stage II sporulation protein M
MLGLVMVIILLLRTGTRTFNREELLGRSLDQLNLRWAGRVFMEQWRGGVDGFRPLQWYRVSVWGALKRLRQPILVFIISAVMAFIGGWLMRDTYPLPLDKAGVSDETTLDNLRDIFEAGQSDPRFVAWAIGQNVRVLVAATFLSIFTFGVMGLIFTALPFGMANISRAGMDPLPFILAIIPHGIVEIPAIIIAGAAALQLGAVVTHPPQHMTVGEAWIRQLADTLKVGFAVVLPLLIIAGILEVHLTPRVVEWVLAR